jgi:fatty acid desaturase
MEPPSFPAMRGAHRRSASDFAELTQAIRQAGLLDRRPGYYAVRVALTLAVLAGAWVVFVYLGDTWWQLVTAVLLAGVWAQVSFIGHEQIFRGRRANDAVGLAHAGLVGLSYGWWGAKLRRCALRDGEAIEQRVRQDPPPYE